MRMSKWGGLAIVASVVMASSPGSEAASFSFDDPQCTNFTTTGPDPHGAYSLTCALTARPACQIKVHPASPVAGSTVTLVAACSGSPFGWVFAKGPTGASQSQITACGTVTPYCTDSVPTPGNVVYTVYGGNSHGHGAVASITVTWR